MLVPRIQSQATGWMVVPVTRIGNMSSRGWDRKVWCKSAFGIQSLKCIRPNVVERSYKVLVYGLVIQDREIFGCY